MEKIRQNNRNDPAGSPLFIVDGIDREFDYALVYRMINFFDVKEIEGFYDTSATTAFESRTLNGVIVLHTTL